MHLQPTRLGKVFHDFRGRQIYVLINTERTLERWEEVGLEWRGPHSRLPENFLYVDRVGPWVVFECIRPDEELLMSAALSAPQVHAAAPQAAPASRPPVRRSKSRSKSS
jgi:hypothetical protein